MRTVIACASMVFICEAPPAAAGDAGCSRDRIEHRSDKPSMLTMEVLDASGFQACAADDAGEVIVGYTISNTTARWTRASGVQQISDVRSIYASVSRSGSRISGVIRYPTDPRVMQRAAIWTEKHGWQVLAPSLPEISDAMRISDNGQFVSGHTRMKPFVWGESLGLLELPLPGERAVGQAHDVADDGEIIVGTVFLDSADRSPRGVRWTHGTLEFLQDATGAHVGSAFVCNADCSVVAGMPSRFPMSDTSRLAYRWQQSTGVEYLPPLAPEPSALAHDGVDYMVADITEDGRTIVGSYYYTPKEGAALVFRGLIWIHGQGTQDLAQFARSHGVDTLSKWRDVHPMDVSRDGRRIVGWGVDAADSVRSFILTLRDRC